MRPSNIGRRCRSVDLTHICTRQALQFVSQRVAKYDRDQGANAISASPALFSAAGARPTSHFELLGSTATRVLLQPSSRLGAYADVGRFSSDNTSLPVASSWIGSELPSRIYSREGFCTGKRLFEGTKAPRIGASGVRYFRLSPSTTRLLVTERTPGTEPARISTMSLSASDATTPSNVTRRLSTIM